MPPGQDGLSEADLGCLFELGPVDGSGLPGGGQGRRQRQVVPEQSVLRPGRVPVMVGIDRPEPAPQRIGERVGRRRTTVHRTRRRDRQESITDDRAARAGEHS